MALLLALYERLTECNAAHPILKFSRLTLQQKGDVNEGFQPRIEIRLLGSGCLSNVLS